LGPDHALILQRNFLCDARDDTLPRPAVAGINGVVEHDCDDGPNWKVLLRVQRACETADADDHKDGKRFKPAHAASLPLVSAPSDRVDLSTEVPYQRAVLARGTPMGQP